MNDPALHLFGVPAAIGIGLFLHAVITRWRAKRRRNAEIALRRSEWRKLSDWRADDGPR